MALAVCAVAGAMLGVAIAAAITFQARVVVYELLLLGGGIGFALGVVVGVTLDTLIFKPIRDNREKRERRLRRQREQESQGPWGI